MNKELLQQAMRLISSSAAMMDYLPHYPRSMGKVMLIDDEEVARIKQDLDKAASILEAIAQPVQPAFDVEKASVQLQESLYDVDYSDYLELIQDGVSAAYIAGREAIAQPVQPTAWMYDWYADDETVVGWLTTDYDEAHSPTMGCHNIIPLYTSAAIAQPVQPVTWQERVFYGKSDGNCWSNWWEVSIYDLKFTQQLASKNPTQRQIRPLYAIAQSVQPVSNEDIDAAVFAEREACAATLDRLYDWSAMSSNYKSGFNWDMQIAADLIRARSQTESIVHKEAI